ncbi:putative secondary metabolism biosynthetic enzyme [Aspergillus luchuensis]|uniref:Putative secondary metabolism biosynthetic enzyme n=1 Tax=Aspergillus kawachii TaxID=1069201 RepID=A0A146EXQ4_ASPKA|nr:putative secondary metabolism biosynthetic enzyme [Aspergillus luchuensis]BCS03050.1 putative secondary metabolism biosynthetic enzyme [Aspergillus luchuensis]BCS14698.1 putative secondary metabolism biosynthetic enzyme [Aspergillus luchuensis]GAA87824.1 short-chain dehydrogenase [Aspergillus luchuensis IFO 4308]GAT18589.1 short-chain dehydrogenase [Aspergillus luchuensis]
MPIFDATATSEQVIDAFKSNIKGKTFVITGAGKPSIGSQIATSLAKAAPAHILIASRTLSKVHPVLDEIHAIDSTIKTTAVQVDLTDHESVRRAADEILVAAPRIDVLINSAGVMAVKEYTLDKQGIELQLSANHVGHFLLTNLLVPALEAAGSARVVNLTSSGHLISPFRFEDWNYSDGKEYDPWTGYGQSKTANILFTYGLTHRLRHKGIAAIAVHPGYNGDTKLGSHLTWDDYAGISAVAKRNTGKEFVFEEPRFKTYTQIAATPLIAALDPGLQALAPVFMQNSVVSEAAGHARDPGSVDALWRLSEDLVGEEFRY